MKVWFNSLAIVFASLTIFPAVTESRFPVGSSAKTMVGRFTNPLAIAALCACPPEILLERLLI